MRIGITYDLREEYLKMGYGEEETAEFDCPETIEAIEDSLRGLGFVTDRIGNVKSLVRRLVEGERWTLVFNIAEGMRGFARESQIPAILDAYDIPYTFSDPMVLALALHKGMTKRIVRDLQIPTPGFIVAENEEALTKPCHLPFPLFAKPVAEGTGKGISAASKIRDMQELLAVGRGLLEKCRQPLLIETFLPGREFTVGITGTGEDATAVGTLEVILLPHAEANAYSYENKEKFDQLVEYRLVDDHMAREAAQTALDSWRGLGCRDAGRVDLRADANGRVHFIEVNPLAGLNPVRSDLPILCSKVGISYQELIGRIMDSAMKRLVAPPSIRYFALDTATGG